MCPLLPLSLGNRQQRLYNTRAEAAGGVGVGRGKGVWGGEEAREGKGGVTEAGVRRGRTSARGRGLEWPLGGRKVFWGADGKKCLGEQKCKLEVAVGDFKDLSLPSPPPG